MGDGCLHLMARCIQLTAFLLNEPSHASTSRTQYYIIPLTKNNDLFVCQTAYLSNVCKGLIESCIDRKLLEIDIVNVP